jgi:hypothetical protein
MKCEACGGNGRVRSRSNYTDWLDCPDCHGTGEKEKTMMRDDTMKDDAWIVQQFLNERGARELSGHCATLGAFERIRDRLAVAERERDDARAQVAECEADPCWTYRAKATAAESRVTRLTEALEKAREGLDRWREWWRNPNLQRPDIAELACRRAEATITAIDAALKGE